MSERSYWEKLRESALRQTERITGVTLIEIVGDSRVLIEHHKGVVQYDLNEICIKTTCGCAVISGAQLTLCEVMRSQLVITGKIESVSIKRRVS